MVAIVYGQLNEKLMGYCTRPEHPKSVGSHVNMSYYTRSTWDFIYGHSLFITACGSRDKHEIVFGKRSVVVTSHDVDATPYIPSETTFQVVFYILEQ